ncbi:MAG: alpha-2-macroglobulin family protein [Trueperaceae bacterium]
MKSRMLYYLALVGLVLGLVAAQEEYIYLYGGGVYQPGDDVRLEHQLPPNARAKLTVYRILNPEKVIELGGPQAFQASEELQLRQVNVYNLRTEDGYYYDTTTIGNLGKGMFFAQLEYKKQKLATLILVTDLSLVVKSDPNKVLVYSTTKDGMPRQAKTYLVRQGSENEDGARTNGSIYAEGLASKDGLTEFSKDIEDNLIVVAKYGEAWAFSSNYWNEWSFTKTKVYLVTDRPVYRPGHTVYFKGTARSPSGLAPLANESVDVNITDPDGNELFSETLTSDAYGSFAGEITLAPEPPLGYYNMVARVKDEDSYGSFEVQEFQKPEYRVTVTSEKENVVQGETATFTINAEYLFGGGVAGANVSYAILEQPFYYWGYRWFYEDYRYGYGGEVTDRQEGTLDAEGNLVVEVPMPRKDYDYQLTLQVGVTDEARREISSSGSVTVYRSSVVLDIRAESYAYEVGETALVNIRANDIDGNPVSIPFTVDTERYFWSENASKTIKGQSFSGQTDAEGNATVSIPLDRQGSFSFFVRATDSKGRKTEAQDYVWVSGNDYWYWSYDGLTIRPDKEEYNVGDTAKIVVQSPIADAYALITHEGKSLGKYELIKLNGSVLTYGIPVTEAMTPNGFIGVTIVGNGTTYYETVTLNVPPVSKYLNVEVTSDSDTYEPGDEGTFELRVSDVDGNPVEAQLTLGLVDEGIYLVHPENATPIQEFFYSYESNLVGTDLSDWFYFGTAAPVPMAAATDSEVAAAEPMMERAALTEDAFAQSKSDLVQPDVREDFKDTILWLPTLETDENGLATATVTFPENLTEWRLTARTITLSDEVGQNTYSVKTSLPVIARLAAPRFFIRGDSANLRVVGQSNLENEVAGQLQITAEGLELSNKNPTATTFPAGGRVTADYKINAKTVGTSNVTASALTGTASDAMKLPISVLPHAIRSDIGWAGSNNTTWTFDLPKNTDLTTTRGKLYLTPSLAAAVAPALEYLVGYPYGCTEQTMSRFYPSVLAKQSGGLVDLPKDIAVNLDDIVAKGLKRLYNFQHDDGGWGFWQYDNSSPFITAYVINGLTDAKAAGYSIDETIFNNALLYLENAINENVESLEDWRLVSGDAKAYAQYALARANYSSENLTYTFNNDVTPYGLALNILTAQENKNSKVANELLEKLLASVKETGSVAYWDTNAPRYYWNDDNIEATAYALQALVKVQPEHPIIPKVVNWLLLNRQGSYWVSTKQTAAIVKASLELAKVTDEANINYKVIAKLNGREVLNQQVVGQSADGVELELSDFVAGQNKLELTVTGQGTLYSSSNITYYAEQDSYTPQTEHFAIKRTYEKLTPRLDPNTQSYVYDRDLTISNVKAGDYVLVTVDITPKDDYRYVLVHDPLPAGFRVVEDDSVFRIADVEPRYGYDWYGWNYWYDGREIRDERVDFYFTYLGDKVTFNYIMRAETPGTFAALPTEAWLMYEPEIRGISNDARLSITE